MMSLNFYNNWKLAKTLDAIIRASLVITGAVVTVQALEVFLAPQVVYAEESPQQRLPKQVKADPQHKYDIKIRESLDLQKDFGNPASALQTLNNLGVAYAKQGNFDIALECYEKAADIDPNYATAFNNTGVAFYRLGYLQKPLNVLRKLLRQIQNMIGLIIIKWLF